MTLDQGSLLYNRYRIIEILGRGGMGAVYHAVDESLGVDVAVKENFFTAEDYARQFRMEAVILAGLRHPNLPRVTDHFVTSDLGQYLVMDYIDGDDLRQRIEKEGPISEKEAIRVGAATCDALAYLHSHKPPVLHRDIKLGNIKITTEGEIYLVDFGLAKMGWAHEETMTGARAMTPGYSPPEQYGSARTDTRSDIYSLSATLYAALTGTIPEDSLARAVDGVDLTPLREHRPEVSPRLAAVIEKALETNTSNRYQSAEAFKRALLDQPEPIDISKKADAAIQPLPSPISHAPSHLETTRRPSSIWRSLGFFLIMLFIAAGAIWLNPLNQKLFQAGLIHLPAFFSTQTPLPSKTPAIIVSKTPSPVITTTLTIISTRSATSTITITKLSPPPTNLPSPAPSLLPSPTSLPSLVPSLPPSSPSPQASELPIIVTQLAPQGGGTGEIAFASIIDNLAQIFISNIDGTNLRQLTTDAKGACNFDWSPDGKQIIFVSPCSEKTTQYPHSGLYLLEVETGKTEALPFMAAGDFDPSWSPSGEKIAFTSLRDGSMQIYVFNLSDASLTRLTSPGNNTQSNYPDWSPDSNQIAFTMHRLGLLQIWSMSADGSNQKQLLRTGGAFSEYLPSWSPDGTSLLFSQTTSSLAAPSSLGRFDLQTRQYNLLSIPSPVVDANFSPDGQWITYETTDTINQDVYICQFPIVSSQRLTTSPENDFDPVWRPGN